MKNKAYSQEELEYIRLNYKTKSDRMISKELGRHMTSVAYKRRAMGLFKRYEPELEHRREFIKENYKEMTDEELAEELNIPVSTVKVYRSGLGISREARKKEYALYQGDDLLSMGSAEEICNELGIKKSSLMFYKTPAHAKRTSEKARRLVEIGYCDEF